MEFTQEQIDKALQEISQMDRYSMAQLLRFAEIGDIHLRSDIPTGKAFTDRFKELGGFSPEISKKLGWNK